MDGRRWYLVQTRARAEDRASSHLSNQGFESYLPRYMAERRHARRREKVARPLFPGYLFVRLDLLQDRWRAVLSTVGVRRLVSAGERPLPVPPPVIAELRAREDARGFVELGRGRVFSRGEPVRITEGPFLDWTGLFDCATDRERVVVLLDLLGRAVRVDVPVRALVAAT